MIFQTIPKARKRFAIFPVRVDRPQTGGSVWIWLERYTREVESIAGGDAVIRTRRINGETFEYIERGYYLGESM